MSRKWKTAQKLESEYQDDQKKRWNINHSLEFWNRILYCDCSTINGVEIGCGNTGVSNFVSSIVGLDPLPLKKPNFVRGVSQSITASSTVTRFASYFRGLSLT